MVESLDHIGHAAQGIGPLVFIALIIINGSSALFSADLVAVSRNANTSLVSGFACLVNDTGMAERSCIKTGCGRSAPLGADAIMHIMADTMNRFTPDTYGPSAP